jgi:hypothetical protein
MIPPFVLSQKAANPSLYLSKSISIGHPFTEEDLTRGIPDEDFREFLKKCWAVDPKERPSIGEIVAKLKEIGGFDDIRDVDSDLEVNMISLTPPKTPPTEINGLPDSIN